MTAHMEKGPAIHGNDLKDLRSGISAIRRKLDSQKIIDEVNIERLGITVGKEVRRMERNFLSSSAAWLPYCRLYCTPSADSPGGSAGHSDFLRLLQQSTSTANTGDSIKSTSPAPR